MLLVRPTLCATESTLSQECLMPSSDPRSRLTIIDYLLYAVAAGVFAVIGFSLLLWLRY